MGSHTEQLDDSMQQASTINVGCRTTAWEQVKRRKRQFNWMSPRIQQACTARVVQELRPPRTVRVA